jgi:hypothetical protein
MAKLDWSWEGLKNSGKGLLTDPEKMQGALDNPWFQMGMGLLSENQKAFGGNPAAGIMGGLTTSRQQRQDTADRKRIEDLREQLAKIIAAQGGGAPQAPAPGQPQMSPAPMQPGQSGNIMDLLKPQGGGVPGQTPGIAGPMQGQPPQAGGAATPIDQAMQFLMMQGNAKPSDKDIQDAMAFLAVQQ